MASLILFLGTLLYDNQQKRKTEKKKLTAARFAELERDNAARIARLQDRLCDCGEGGDHRREEHPGADGGGGGGGKRMTPPPGYEEEEEEEEEEKEEEEEEKGRRKGMREVKNEGVKRQGEERMGMRMRKGGRKWRFGRRRGGGGGGRIGNEKIN